MEQLKELPLSIANFKNMIDSNFIYVDKTELIAEIACKQTPFFLARPRRFGKSTLISTFEELFSRGLQRFKGLKIETDGLFKEEKTYKILHFDFSDCTPNKDIEKYLTTTIKLQLELNGIDIDSKQLSSDELLKSALTRQENLSFVLLIDEYDTPLTQVLDNKQLFIARRDILSAFYAVIKQFSSKFRFTFITGITRYSHLSIFSAFNNLVDLSFNPTYGSLLGYTQEELELYFKDYIENAVLALNRKENTFPYSYESILHLLKLNYDGYCFEESASTFVYNPWSILNFLAYPSSIFTPYWLQSGGATPTLLVKYLEQKNGDGKGQEYEHFLNIDHTFSVRTNRLTPNLVDLSSEDFSFEAILYQAGYLSIKSLSKYGDLMVGIPNLEVKRAYAQIIIDFLGTKISSNFTSNFKSKFRSALDEGRYADSMELMNQLTNTLSYETVASYNESSFRDLFKLAVLFADATGIQSEAPNALGRSDLIFEFNDTCFVCEFKLAKSLKDVSQKLTAAKQQIKTNKYNRLINTKKVVALAIVALNQPKDNNSGTEAVREFVAIEEV